MDALSIEGHVGHRNRAACAGRIRTTDDGGVGADHGIRSGVHVESGCDAHALLKSRSIGRSSNAGCGSISGALSSGSQVANAADVEVEA